MSKTTPEEIETPTAGLTLGRWLGATVGGIALVGLGWGVWTLVRPVRGLDPPRLDPVRATGGFAAAGALAREPPRPARAARVGSLALGGVLLDRPASAVAPGGGVDAAATADDPAAVAARAEEALEHL